MKKIGRGYSSIFYGTGYGNGFPDESRATVVLECNGIVNIYVEVSDVGSGGLSVMWQIAKETLNINKELIHINNTNTSYMKDSGTAAASRQTYNTGNAVLDCCKKLRRTIDIVIKDNNIILNHIDNSLNQKDLINIYTYIKLNNMSLKEEGYFKATTTQINSKTGEGNPYWPYTFSAQRVTVSVDDETGKIDVLEIVAVNDAGKIINAVLAEGQSVGGCAMGIGYALMEEVLLDNGTIKNSNFSNYIIPTTMDMPNVKSYFIEDIESSGPYGAKGLGEPTMIPTAPAILNAIYDAIGIRFYELPVTCDKVILALKNNNII